MSEPFLQLFGGEDGGRQSSLDRATRGNVASSELSSIAITQGTVSADVSLTASTPLAIPHGLNRIPTGAILVASDAYVRLKTNAKDTNSITIESDATAVVSLWIF